MGTFDVLLRILDDRLETWSIVFPQALSMEQATEAYAANDLEAAANQDAKHKETGTCCRNSRRTGKDR